MPGGHVQVRCPCCEQLVGHTDDCDLRGLVWIDDIPDEWWERHAG